LGMEVVELGMEVGGLGMEVGELGMEVGGLGMEVGGSGMEVGMEVGELVLGWRMLRNIVAEVCNMLPTCCKLL